jgi:hypothetical protein
LECPPFDCERMKRYVKYLAGSWKVLDYSFRVLNFVEISHVRYDSTFQGYRS